MASPNSQLDNGDLLKGVYHSLPSFFSTFRWVVSRGDCRKGCFSHLGFPAFFLPSFQLDVFDLRLWYLPKIWLRHMCTYIKNTYFILYIYICICKQYPHVKSHFKNGSFFFAQASKSPANLSCGLGKASATSYGSVCSVFDYSYNYIYCIIWVNYNSSLTWNKAIWGWFPLLTIIPVRSQWGHYKIPRYI